MIGYVLLSVLLALAAASWLVVVTEGAYLGKNAVTALYDWGASSYDRVKQALPHDDANYLARPLLAALGGIASPLMLDVATGTGRLPLALLRQWDFQGRVVGLDLSKRMLAIARRRTLAHRDRMGLAWQDAMALPFRDEAFHAVTCLEALELLPNPEGALVEMLRVLRPGGQLMVSNRVGRLAPFFPGRVYRAEILERNLRALGLTHITARRWQTQYDLVNGQKPAQGMQVR